MLARWGTPALKRPLRSTRARWAYFHSQSCDTDDPRVSKMEIYAENGERRFDMNFYNYGERNRESPLVIYLPGTSSDQMTQSHDENQKKCLDLGISESLGQAFRVVRVNYRWSKECQFPSPTHDVLIAYDIIVKHLCTPKTKIGVYGRYLGGTLATSLALTESKKRSPSSIAVLATANAILDWTSIPTVEVIPNNTSILSHIKDSRARALAAESRKDAVTMRERLFHHPSSCFDSFASPILFFRGAGRDVPEEFNINFMPTEIEVSEHLSSSPELMGKRSSPTIRKSHIRFPPKLSNLVIPKTRITTSCGGWREQQGQELAKFMKRSVVMYEMKDNADRDVDAEDEAENRIQFEKEQTSNLEGLLKAEEKIVAWLEEALENC